MKWSQLDVEVFCLFVFILLQLTTESFYKMFQFGENDG